MSPKEIHERMAQYAGMELPLLEWNITNLPGFHPREPRQIVPIEVPVTADRYNPSATPPIPKGVSYVLRKATVIRLLAEARQLGTTEEMIFQRWATSHYMRFKAVPEERLPSIRSFGFLSQADFDDTIQKISDLVTTPAFVKKHTSVHSSQWNGRNSIVVVLISDSTTVTMGEDESRKVY